jgi:cytidyltransferase-like protein
MSTARKKKIGVFLGRLQPQHQGHEAMIDRIFRENDEVVLCLGSAQRLDKDDPQFSRNPLPKAARLRRLRAFLQERDFQKPYRLVTAVDIEPDSAWPAYLKDCCRLDDTTLNTIYFADAIPPEYAKGLEEAGFRLKFLRRVQFLYAARKKVHRLSSATEIRALGEI